MGLFIGAPNLFAGVVVGVYFTVFDSADFANGLGGAGGFSALMGTGISALFALAVFPFVVFLGDRNRAAAIPLLRMSLFVGAPDLFAGVVVGVYFAVLGKANITNGLCRTGCGSADMAVANDGSVADNCADNIDSSVIGKGFSFGNGENGSLGDVKGHTVFHGDISRNGGISDNLALIAVKENAVCN